MNVSIFTRLRWFYWRLPLYGRFAVLLIAAAGVTRLLPEPSVEDSRPSDRTAHLGQPTYDPVKKWGQAKVTSAAKVMALARQDSTIYEEGSHLVVEMELYFEDPDQRLQYIRAIADSDVILQGAPRNIYFYDPANRQIGQADTINGVRLTN